MSVRSERRIAALACDSCAVEVEVDAGSLKDALRQIGATYSYGDGFKWARVTPADRWDVLTGSWLPGDNVTLCPRCYVGENRERLRRQGRDDEETLVAEHARRQQYLALIKSRSDG